MYIHVACNKSLLTFQCKDTGNAGKGYYFHCHYTCTCAVSCKYNLTIPSCVFSIEITFVLCFYYESQTLSPSMYMYSV